MGINLRKLISFLSFCLLLASLQAAAQQAPPSNPPSSNAPQTPPPTGTIPLEEWDLEEQLNNELGASENTEGLSADELMMVEDTGYISPVAPITSGGSSVDDDDDDDDESSRVRYIEPRYAMNGYSLGAQIWTHSYDIKASIRTRVLNPGGDIFNTVDLSSSSADFQSIGVVGRYAILPYDKIGADINVTAGTSVNHGSNGISAIYTVRGEFNLAYTVEVADSSALYVLAGVGYEMLFGEDIQKLVSGGGGTMQVGGGLKMGSNLSVEVFYARVARKVSDDLYRRAGQAAIAAGAADYTSQGGSVTAQMISGRLLFSF